MIPSPDCKSLAPTWEKLASDFSAEPSVLVAKVDAEAENSKATAQDQEVHSYPTIKYFPKGSTTPEAYEGGRTEEQFVDFINQHAGTHRLPGGLLDPKGGTIDSLDTLVGAATGNWEALKSQVGDAAKGLKDKYAEYYVKVAGKMGSSQEYAEKELSRLQGILKKGGLAPEKVDDLVSRSNILRKFVPESEKSEL